MPKNVQNTEQLHSFLMLVMLFSKSLKMGFSRMWMENFQLYKLGLEKAEELEIKVSTFLGFYRKEFQKNFCFIDYSKAFDCVDHNKLCKILRDRILDKVICLLRNLYVGQEATVRTGHGTMDWFQIVKGVHQDCILSPCLFKFSAEYIIWNASLDEW